jgi:hypothetical protein
MEHKGYLFTVLIALASLIYPSTAQAAPLYGFSSHTFTNCSATGQNGPSLANCQSSYSSATWASNTSYLSNSSGIQLWTAPSTGLYQITAAGATGNGNAKTEGLGAIIRATVSLTQGSTYKIMVGQYGLNGGCGSGGGGGGTFFTDNSNTPIIVAGGGAGSYLDGVSSATRANGQTTTSGSAPSHGSASGGTGGNGGGADYWSSGGGGLTGNGTNASGGATAGKSFTNGGQGGGTNTTAFGGFGGGGGTHGCTGGGAGGGGYSGGAGGNQTAVSNGGGGGSFIAAGATNIATSNGSYAGSSTGITNLNAYNGTYGSATLASGYLTITLQLDPVTVTVSSISGASTGTYATLFPIQATLSASGGKVTFYALGKTIPGCIKIYTSTMTITCNWKPNVKGVIAIYAKVVPDNGASTSPSSPVTFLIGRRTGLR